MPYTLDEINKVIEKLTTDPVRLRKEKVWNQSEKQLQGYLRPRVDNRGSDLAQVNFNQTAKAVSLLYSYWG